MKSVSAIIICLFIKKCQMFAGEQLFRFGNKMQQFGEEQFGGHNT